MASARPADQRASRVKSNAALGAFSLAALVGALGAGCLADVFLLEALGLLVAERGLAAVARFEARLTGESRLLGAFETRT